MARPIAIVDNSFLAYSSKFKQANLFKGLRLFFDYILFPAEVLAEFQPKNDLPENQIRNQIIGQIQISQGFYRRCIRTDPVTYTLLKTIDKVDPGEAETIAQSLTMSIPYILMDDKKALKHLPDFLNSIRVYNTLTVISLMDISQYIQDYDGCIRGIHSIRKFKSRDLRKSYLQAQEHIGITLSKKHISYKTSLKRILAGS